MKVCVLDRGVSSTKNMFKKRGYELETSPSKADMVVWTGGEDVCPFLYNDLLHPTTRFNLTRDEYEKKIFDDLHIDIIKIGICRGAQFLNVMNGGLLWQNVDGHTRDHKILLDKGNNLIDFSTFKDSEKDKKNLVTSTHHQMMRAAPDGIVVGYADESSLKEAGDFTVVDNFLFDTEVVLYKSTRTICFQPHPEYGNQFTENLFFHILENVRWV